MSRNPKPTAKFNRAPADHVDWSKARRVRLPVSLLERIKVAANKRETAAFDELGLRRRSA